MASWLSPGHRAPFCPPTPFWLPQMCPSYSTLFSWPICGRTRASSAAASSPSRFQDSLQGREGAQSQRQESSGGETRWQVGRAGGIAPPVWVPDGVLCAFPEDSTGHSRLLPTPPTPFPSWSSHGNPDSLGAGCPEGSGHVTVETTGSELPPCTCLPPNFATPMHHHLTFFFKSVLYPLSYSL